MNLRIEQKQVVKRMPVLCYSRVSGYFASTSQINRGKKEEFSQRKYLNIGKFVNARTGNETGL